MQGLHRASAGPMPGEQQRIVQTASLRGRRRDARLCPVSDRQRDGQPRPIHPAAVLWQLHGETAGLRDKKVLSDLPKKKG